jgi:hypothetical protein
MAVSATYLVGLVTFGAWLGPAGLADTEPAEQVAVLLEHGSAVLAVETLLYLFGGAAMALLALGVHEQLRHAAPLLRRAASFFGLAWSGLLLAAGLVAVVGQQVVVDLHAAEPERATTAWVAIHSVHDALGGGVELVGGLWVLLVCLAARRSASLARGLTGLGVALGVVGVFTVVPVLEPLTAVFGLGMLVWFAWVGFSLLRADSPAT